MPTHLEQVRQLRLENRSWDAWQALVTSPNPEEADDLLALWLNHFVGRFADEYPGRQALLLWDAVAECARNGTLGNWSLEEMTRQQQRGEQLLAGAIPLVGISTEGTLPLLRAAFDVARCAVLLFGQEQRTEDPAAVLLRAAGHYASFWDGKTVTLQRGQRNCPRTWVASVPFQERFAALEAFIICALEPVGYPTAAETTGRAMARHALLALLGVLPETEDERQTTVLFVGQGVGCLEFGTTARLSIRRLAGSGEPGVFYPDPTALGLMTLDDDWRRAFERACTRSGPAGTDRRCIPGALSSGAAMKSRTGNGTAASRCCKAAPRRLRRACRCWR